jgi:hypothetical protein
VEEEIKNSIEPISLDRLSVLTGFRQRMIIAEKINEIINKLNLDCEPSDN